MTSPLEYWRANLTRIQNPAMDVKLTSTCVADKNTTDRICFDRIGVPVL